MIKLHKGLFIGIPVSIVLWVMIFFCFNAFADDEFYFYGVIKTNLIKVATVDGDRIVPDVPFMLYSYYAVSNGVSLTYTQDLKNEGKEIMALIAVKREDEEALKAWSGYIGDNFDTVKRTATYAKHYPFKIKDIKSHTDDEGTLIPYLGVDKNDPARFAVWDK